MTGRHIRFSFLMQVQNLVDPCKLNQTHQYSTAACSSAVLAHQYHAITMHAWSCHVAPQLEHHRTSSNNRIGGTQQACGQRRRPVR
jgi:hypothetical protein